MIRADRRPEGVKTVPVGSSPAFFFRGVLLGVLGGSSSPSVADAAAVVATATFSLLPDADSAERPMTPRNPRSATCVFANNRGEERAFA